MKIKIIRLIKRKDPRGWLIENNNRLIKESMRHFLISSSKPGVVRGQHYHSRKREWFLVLKGKAKIVCKALGSNDIKEIYMSEERPEMVEIPPMIAHAIENIGDKEMLLFAVVNESLDRRDPDTFPHRVI